MSCVDHDLKRYCFTISIQSFSHSFFFQSKQHTLIWKKTKQNKHTTPFLHDPGCR